MYVVHGPRRKVRSVRKKDIKENHQSKEKLPWRVEMRNNEELDNLYKEPTIIGSLKSMRISWVGHVMEIDTMDLVDALDKDG